MNWDTIDWSALAEMRTAFLAGTAGSADYWRNESDLAAYDATFAQRIGWKWDFVLSELQQRGWTPPPGELWDWGCGSGIAARAVLDYFGTEAVTKLRVSDRSPLAMSFAARRAREKYAGLAVEPAAPTAGLAGNTLLLSHVLTELTQEQTEALVEQTAQAQCVIWVEPGTYETSLTLIAIRERLRPHFQIIAPCTQQERCGVLAPENERHWCHHFATPPPEVFIDSGWARFANLMSINLRDLPLSFLVLDRRQPPALPADAARLIGHPRLYKGHALLLGCDRQGVSEQRLAQRKFTSEFKAFKKGKHCSLCQWHCADGEIQRYQSLL